ncbi:unnamed protein product, partial [Eruca vesicaria subsp. sativa]|nr:unnamed protein product [Eruca vesicaria subsp. sativa]
FKSEEETHVFLRDRLDKEEINETLQEGFEKIEDMMYGEDDLYTVSIIFWVLRRYVRSQLIFRRFKMNNGSFKDSLTGDA